MQLTSNTQAFIEAEVYSNFILMNLHDGLLPEAFYRNVADFMNGSTLNIKTIGSVTLQEATEDVALVYNPIESGEITFAITEYVGAAWYVTDSLREDGSQIDYLMSAHSIEATRAIQEKFETDFLAAAANPYTLSADPFNVNGFPHHVVSAEVNNIFSLSHFIKLRLAFDKANVPAEGRVFIVDPVVEATLNNKISVTNDVTAFASNILEKGLASGQRFFKNYFGWDILVSNRLYVGAANDGTTSLASGVYNLGMCILDDNTKPMMGAWRRLPKSEGERNKDLRRDEFTSTARWGFGLQRMDTLCSVVTSTTAIE